MKQDPMNSFSTTMVTVLTAFLLLIGCGGGTQETTKTTSSGSDRTSSTDQQRTRPVVWSLADGGEFSAAPGGTITIRLRVTAAPGVRLYTDREYGGLEFAPVPTTAILQPHTLHGSTGEMVADEGSTMKIDPHFGDQQLEYWIGTVTVNVPITLAENVEPGYYDDVSIVINYMSCTDKVCYPPADATVPITIRVSAR